MEVLKKELKNLNDSNVLKEINTFINLCTTINDLYVLSKKAENEKLMFFRNEFLERLKKVENEEITIQKEIESIKQKYLSEYISDINSLSCLFDEKTKNKLDKHGIVIPRVFGAGCYENSFLMIKPSVNDYTLKSLNIIKDLAMYRMAIACSKKVYKSPKAVNTKAPFDGLNQCVFNSYEDLMQLLLYYNDKEKYPMKVEVIDSDHVKKIEDFDYQKHGVEALEARFQKTAGYYSWPIVDSYFDRWSMVEIFTKIIPKRPPCLDYDKY